MRAHDRLQQNLIAVGLTIGLMALSGCEEVQSLNPSNHQPPQTEAAPPASIRAKTPEVANPPQPLAARAATQIVGGTGTFVQPVAPPVRGTSPPPGAADGDITLNFVNTDVREVLPRVLGDVLHLDFTIDPKVDATVTIQTSRPLRRDDVLPTLQEALRASGLTLVQSANGIYRLVAGDQAARSGTLPVVVGSGPAGAPRGYNDVQILPLKFASADELSHTLEPFLPKGAVMEPDIGRNLLILSGGGADLSTIVDMVKAFDVDWIKGMSYAIVPVQAASPKSAVDQLSQIFGPHGSVPLPGMLSFAPLDRMNAVLVVSPQRAYLDQARQWIERIDRGEDENRPQIYEYHVQNSRATDLAKVLGALFASGTGGNSGQAPQTAPGTTPTTIGSSLSGNSTSGTSTLGGSSLGSNTSSGSLANSSLTSAGTSSIATSPLTGSALTSPIGASAALASSTPSAIVGGGNADGLELPQVRIVADEKNNNLIIYARPQTYRMIEQALQKIDVVPLQVLMEATIAEVTLGNDLQYGLQYFFHAHENQFMFGSTSTAIAAGTAIAGTFPGFNYVLGGTNANVVLNLLSSITNVHVVSAPELLVLDHQTASLLVGSQIPIPTAQIQSTATSDAPLVSTIQYVDTGVIVKVTPQVNANGLVTLEISQEVSAVDNTSTSATATLGPSITQRRLQSTITVQDGETVALGGLIQDSNSLTRVGLPVLSDIPVVGPLFRSTDHNVQRTELLVLLSPRVLHDSSDARAATQELQKRLQSLQNVDATVP